MVSERAAAAGYGEAEGGCGLAVMPDHEDLSMEVRHLSARISSLTQEVGTIEARQVALDRRLVEFGGLVQGLQEEQYTQSCALKQSQKTLACGAQRALDTAVAVQQQMEQEDAWETCMERMGSGVRGRGGRHGSGSTVDHGLLQELERRCEARLEEHTRWLIDLQSDMAAMTLEGPAAFQSSALARQREAPGADGTGPIGARISALEKGQRTVAVSARRALQTAIIVHQQQQTQEQEELSEKDEERHKALEDLVKPVTELEQQCSHRFTAQDERMDKILQMVDTLADRVLMQGRALPDGEAEGEHIGGEGGAAVVTETLEVVSEMREKMDDLEANVYGLAAQLQALQQQAQQQGGFTFAQVQPNGGGVSQESFVTTIESLEARVDRSLGEVDRNLNEVCQRLDSLQEGRDQQRLTLRQMSNELPEVSQKLDQLWSQCQYYFPRVKEHDVHFSFFRTSFESHKQHMLDVTDGLDTGCLSERSRTSSQLPAFKTPSPFGSDRLGGLAAGGLGLGGGGGLGGLGGLPASGDRLGAGVGLLGGAPAADRVDEGPKARMLSQVMARLYADSDSGLSARGQGAPE